MSAAVTQISLRLKAVLIGLLIAPMTSTIPPVIVLALAAEPLPDAPKPLKRVNPKYPRAAESRDLAGRVRLVIEVAPAGGKPISVQVEREAPKSFEFGEAAADAVRKWEYPAGVPGKYGVTVSFTVDAYGVAPPPEPPLPAAPPPVDAVLPIYPTAARVFGLEGTPEVAVRISRDGRVQAISVIRRSYASSDPSIFFGNAAATAVRQWRFPEGREGVYTVAVAFTLERLAAGELAREEFDR